MSSDQSNRTRMFVFLAVCTSVLFVTLLAQSRVWAVQSQPSSSGADLIHKLRVERRDLLRQSEEFLEVLYKKGQSSSDELAITFLDLQSAELDLCTNAQERIRVHEKTVDKMRWCEGHANAAHQAGRTLLSDVVRAKARRLKAEIELEQARL